MAVDMFLKIEPNCEGESNDKTHAGEIDVLAWNWGMSQSGSMHVATGGGSGKVSVQDITITKKVDKSSPKLIKYCCDGNHFEKALLTVRKAGGGNPVEYLKLEMKPVIITNISTGGSQGDDTVMETVTLNFAKFKVMYQPQDDKGAKKGGSVDQGWDISQNTTHG